MVDIFCQSENLSLIAMNFLMIIFFMMVAMPDDTSDGIVLFRLSQLREVVEGIIENWERPVEDI